jgi:hypothetical protein
MNSKKSFEHAFSLHPFKDIFFGSFSTTQSSYFNVLKCLDLLPGLEVEISLQLNLERCNDQQLELGDNLALIHPGAETEIPHSELI